MAVATTRFFTKGFAMVVKRFKTQAIWVGEK